jgi:autotransporter-associated beta strand protein
MRKRLALLAALAPASVASVASAAGVIYDGFEYDTTGNPILGTIKTGAGAAGEWTTQGNGTVEPRLYPGSLSYSGLPASVGNKMQLDNGGGGSTGADASRLYFPAVTSGTLYYSMIVNLPNTGGIAGGAFFTGFDQNSNATYVTNAGLYVRPDAGDNTKFNFGIAVANLGNGSFLNYSATQVPTNTPVLVVGSFTFGGLSNLDIFVDPTAVPLAEPGAHSVSTSGADNIATSLRNIFIRGNSGQPQGIQLDEVRVGTTWADVAAHTFYWDVDGANPGSGGATPSGIWDDTAANFNTDPAGGGAGETTANPGGLGTINFSAGGDATGSYTVNVSGTRGARDVNIGGGNVTLDGGTLAVGTFNVAAGATGTVTSVLTGSPSFRRVNKTGPGTLTLTGVNTHTGGTTVSEGTLVLGNADALNAGALTVANGATARLAPALPKAVTAGTVSTAGTGQLDITDNSMVVRSLTVAQVQALIQTAFNAGQWNGAGGITSSTAATASPAVTAIGFAGNDILNRTEFKGVGGLTTTDVLVKYTYYGDSDLNGATTLDDYTLFLNGYQTAGTTWVQGDYDYNGLVTLDDFTLFLAGYQQQGAPLSELEAMINAVPMSTADRTAMLAAVAAVPEPASLAMLGLAAGGVFGRRRRRR